MCCFQLYVASLSMLCYLKKNYHYYHLFPAEISLTLKNKNSILKSEKYAKPQNNTLTDFSTHIEKMIFIYCHKAAYNTYYSSAMSYKSAIPIDISPKGFPFQNKSSVK